MNFQHDGALPRDIVGYHRRTKHAPTRYALGPAFLDWTSQPSPYRTFAGTRLIILPLQRARETPGFPGGGAAPAALDCKSLGLFLELAFGISAWKSAEGSTWAVRNNPSSGNLHPTEAYVVLPALAGLGGQTALYHYAPEDHALEERALYDASVAPPSGGFLLGLSSIPWREAWKYGERAYRYCQLDAGHAAGSAAQAAAALGWSAAILPEPSDADVAALLGLTRPDAAHRREPEHPDFLMFVATNDGPQDGAGWRVLTDAPRVWRGAANRLSEDHDGWPLVDLAAEFCRKPRTNAIADARLASTPGPAPGAAPVADVVRLRRSAQRFDGKAILSAASFSAMLAALAPGGEPLLSIFPWPAALTLVIFAHRVEALEPGLYALGRDPDVFSRFRAAIRQDFDWAPNAIDGSSLVRLRRGGFEKEATRLSCLQAIAGKGCFSLAMIADFERSLEKDGAFAYRRLHWEAGLIGQALYLWATAAGLSGVGRHAGPEQAAASPYPVLSGTGVGCFFDDEVHALLGLSPEDMLFQDIYHFTVGAPVEDARILTLPAYPDGR